MASKDPEHREEKETAAVEDEDTEAQIAPIVKLEEVTVTTGEEDEDLCKAVSTEDKELASGSGLISPTKARDPGLGIMMGGNKQYDCKNFKPTKGVDVVNYPSMHFQVEQNVTTFSAIFKRIVKNVGNEDVTYNAKVVSTKGLSIKVEPSTLTFKQVNRKRSFTVILKRKLDQKEANLLSGSVTWKDC